MMKFALPVFVIALMLGAPGAQARQTLTEERAGRFAASLEEVTALADAMKAEGKDAVLMERVREELETAGENFSPYRASMDAMKTEFPNDFQRLGTIVRDHGFRSQEEWAETGDRAIKAYTASELDPAARAEMESARQKMTPEMMAQVPEAYRAKMKAGLAMMESIASVSDAEIAAIQPYKEELRDYTNRYATR